MKKPFFKACIQATFLLIFSINAFSQVETLSTGSFIINMGATNPNTIGNGLKPYGLIYDVMKNHNVPVKWFISQTKIKDGVGILQNGNACTRHKNIFMVNFRVKACENMQTQTTCNEIL